MSAWAGFAIGLYVGVFVGLFLAALMRANGRDEAPAWQWKDETE